DKGVLLFAPGKTPAQNLQFITFVANAMAAVHRHNGLLKASISSATNAHRLGANEAPPAIISIFTGKQIADIIDKIVNSTEDELITLGKKEGIDMGVAQIPEILLDNTDRNRTSPFAFTGNRFEFRAVGSSANCASAMIALNAAVADQLREFKKKVDARVEREESLYHAILEEVRALLIESKNIHFDGNGYSDEWKEEARRRGLDCETSVPRIFDAYLTPESVKMFESTGVFTEFELKARNEVKWETYTKKIQIEARVLGDLAINHIVPVATRYQSLLVDNVVKLKTIFPEAQGLALTERDRSTIEKLSEHMSIIKEETERMVNARKAANAIECEREKAIAYHDNVVPAMEIIRYHIDKLELMVDNEMWPLPKYREMLFIR
ncbi:MAG: glutamine synthetase type III, partial [Muribaculaceae bacterium]|nr:glutamine synthetase type III [Muribaculaceae bacterium]